MSYSTKQLLWLQEALEELQLYQNLNQHPRKQVLYGDNQGTLSLIQNQKINDLTKHVAITNHQIRILVFEQGCVDL